jgi:hypothetical protein
MRKAAHPSASGGMGSSNPRRWSRGGTHKIVKNILLHFLIFELGDPKIYMSIR